MNTAPPGLYFLGPCSTAPDLLESIGPFRAGASGHLTSRAHRNGWHLFFDGILTHGRQLGRTDAETALHAFLHGGLDALHALEGFYNVLLLHGERQQVYLFSDPLCTRPWYLYESGEALAAAPTPLAFAEWKLSMSLDRLELFHLFRFMNTSLGRTLVREVERLLPGMRYELEGGVPLRRRSYQSFAYREDRSITFEESVERMKSFFAGVMHGVLTHPRLAGLPVHLPLTAGLDSRHILGELLAQDRPPAALRHIRFQTSDYEPVRQMAEGLGLPLLCAEAAGLDWPHLVHRWMHRSGGLVHVHQAHFLEMAQRVPPGGALGFNGYLMDLLMAINPWHVLPSGADPAEHLWDRHYTRRGMLNLLLPDAAALADDSLARFRTFARRFEGPDWYRLTLLHVHHRGLHYTGPMDPMFADDVFHFSPGAHVRSLDYFLTVPRDVAGNRRARLEAMRRYFPELADYPNAYGRPYSAYDTLHKPRAKKWQYVRPWLQALLSGLRKDPAPESVHARLRHIPDLRCMHYTAVHDSALVREGHLRRMGAEASWRLLNLGGYQGWALTSLLTAEVAYRLLVKHESPEAVADWLLPAESS